MTKEYRNSTDKSNPFVISSYIEFDGSGRALCPACSPSHDSQSKTLSLVPNTDGAYKCFRGCEPKEIREALGQAKPSIIPTALARTTKPKKVSVSKERIIECGLLTGDSFSQYRKSSISWLQKRNISTDLISRHKIGITRCRVGNEMSYAVTIPIPDGEGDYYQKKRVAPWDESIKQHPEYKPWKQFGIPQMVYFSYKPENAEETWLCEGEWDAIRLGDLLRRAEKKIAVACFTCGASSVPPKHELDRLPGSVTVFYDRNDVLNKKGEEVGAAGAKKAAAKLGDRCKIAEVPMAENCTTKGYDVSDALDSGYVFESFERAAVEATFVGEQYLTEFDKQNRSLEDLFDTAPDYVEWLVPDLLTTNELYCLAAEPRAGKSLFALGLAKAIASGGKFLDRPCQQGDVFYVCAEDPDDKVKERLLAQGWTREEMRHVTINNNFTLTDLPSMVEYVKTNKPSLVILDTLSRINPNASCENSSEIVDLLAPLQNLAQQENVAILVVHHTRKKSNVETDILDIFDSVRGSGAIRATCRGMLVLCKAKDSYRLAVENGRTAVQDLRVHLNIANLTWLLNGFWTPPTVNLSQKEVVMEWMRKHREGSVKQVSEAVAIHGKLVSNILNNLKDEKILKKIGTQRNSMYYYEPVHSVHQGELEVNSPNNATTEEKDLVHKLLADTEKVEQSEQLCNDLLSPDHFVQKIEQKNDFSELSANDAQCTIVDSGVALPQQFTRSSLGELKTEKLNNLNCSKNLPDSGREHTTYDSCTNSSNFVDIASFEELAKMEDEIVGLYHKKKGYYKFLRLQGKRIYGIKSGMNKEEMFYWNGCTGKVEVKE